MFRARMISSLEKVFSDTEPSCASFTSFSMLKNERSSFQLAFYATETSEYELSVSGWEQGSLSVYEIVEVNSDLPAFEDSDCYYLRKTPGLYPDLLRPLDGGVFSAEGEKWHSIWIELDASNVPAGKHDVFVTLSKGKETVTNIVTAEVINVNLPDQELMCTLWFHSDCLATYYDVEVFIEEHESIIENYIVNAVLH